MPVHTVDPDWFRKLLSPPFFISLAATFICTYIISPFLANYLISPEKYQKLGKKTGLLHTYLASAIHGVAACIFASSTLVFGDMWNNKIFSTSPAAAMTLYVTLGYTVADTIQCYVDPHTRGVYSNFVHHIAILTGMCMGLYHQLFLFFIVYRLLSEFSTPFVDLWSVIREVGDRRGWWYRAASVGMICSFFLCRIAVIPWLNYQMFTSILSSDGAVVPVHLSIIMVVNYSAFDLINLYWFSKMLKGGYKLLFLRKPSKE